MTAHHRCGASASPSRKKVRVWFRSGDVKCACEHTCKVRGEPLTHRPLHRHTHSPIVPSHPLPHSPPSTKTTIQCQGSTDANSPLTRRLPRRHFQSISTSWRLSDGASTSISLVTDEPSHTHRDTLAYEHVCSPVNMFMPHTCCVLSVATPLCAKPSYSPLLPCLLPGLL